MGLMLIFHPPWQHLYQSINGSGWGVGRALGPNRISTIHGNHLTAAAVVETIYRCFGDRKTTADTPAQIHRSLCTNVPATPLESALRESRSLMACTLSLRHIIPYNIISFQVSTPGWSEEQPSQRGQTSRRAGHSRPPTANVDILPDFTWRGEEFSCFQLPKMMADLVGHIIAGELFSIDNDCRVFSRKQQLGTTPPAAVTRPTCDCLTGQCVTRDIQLFN